MKHTSDLVPMCHPLPVPNAPWILNWKKKRNHPHLLHCENRRQTGVEMEALTGVQVTLLTIYDMCKAIDKHMVMTDIHLVEKTGGKSGDFVFERRMNT